MSSNHVVDNSLVFKWGNGERQADPPKKQKINFLEELYYYH